jgi:hypothetical protein
MACWDLCYTNEYDSKMMKILFLFTFFICLVLFIFVKNKYILVKRTREKQQKTNDNDRKIDCIIMDIIVSFFLSFVLLLDNKTKNKNFKYTYTHTYKINKIEVTVFFFNRSITTEDQTNINFFLLSYLDLFAGRNNHIQPIIRTFGLFFS